jgi:hypothetical protein
MFRTTGLTGENNQKTFKMASRLSKIISWCEKPVILGLVNASFFILLALWISLFGAGHSDGGGVFRCAILLQLLNYPVCQLTWHCFDLCNVKLGGDNYLALFFFTSALPSFFYWFAIGIVLKIIFPFIAKAFHKIATGYRWLVTALERKAYGSNLEK